MDRKTKRYEEEKRKIASKPMNCEEYERAVKEIARKTNY